MRFFSCARHVARPFRVKASVLFLTIHSLSQQLIPDRSFVMDDISTDLYAEADMEILPPTPAAGGTPCAEPCLCCGCSHVAIDDDGCGICDHCLSP
jgi:hypothetical protein